MGKRVKVLVFSIAMGLITIIGLIIWDGFKLMEIEDRYGNLQQFYYMTETGDLIINESQEKFGFIKKENSRVSVQMVGGSECDILVWLSSDDTYRADMKAIVYRLTNNGTVEFSSLDYKGVKELIRKKELKPLEIPQ